MQDPHIFGTGTLTQTAAQSIIGAAEHRAWKQLLAPTVVSKRPRFAYQVSRLRAGSRYGRAEQRIIEPQIRLRYHQCRQLRSPGLDGDPLFIEEVRDMAPPASRNLPR
jgi:hypothetical protein